MSRNMPPDLGANVKFVFDSEAAMDVFVASNYDSDSQVGCEILSYKAFKWKC